jgi:hypothetical protein
MTHNTRNQAEPTEVQDGQWNQDNINKGIDQAPLTTDSYRNLSPGMNQQETPFTEGDETVQGDTQAGSTESFSKT